MNTFNWYQKIFSLICLTVIFVLTVGNVNASPMPRVDDDFAAVDAYITEQMNALGIPGMALGIVRGDQVVHVHGFGVADSTGRSVTPQTPLYIGSVTKSFTALAVMQLVEDGKVDLDAPVEKYLPWFQVANQDASAKITVRDLLNHTSGISEKEGNRVWASQQGLEETLRGFGRLPLAHPVGAKWEYSNLNYSAAGLIVEKVSGQPYADYVIQNILEPLDMRHSYTSRTLALADGLSKGHYYMFGHAFEGDGPLPPSDLPSGLLISSAEDMTHYVIAQLNDGQYRDAVILSPQGVAELHHPSVPMQENSFYAMGWAVSSLDGAPAVWHTGDTAYFHSMTILVPDQKLGITLLANASGFVQIEQVDDVAKSILSMLNGKMPAPVSLPIAMRILYWTILLMPFLQMAGILYGWRNRGRVKGWRVWAVVILYIAIGIGFLQIPIPFPIPSMIVFYPELAYGLIATAVLGIGWSLVYAGLYLRNRRMNQE
jgi:CubicO group peptidase (beta-lactamase class C family)